jgi:hypothetical protein
MYGQQGYVSEGPGNSKDVSGEDTLCMDATKCTFKCFHSGDCDRCCKGHGWDHGKCVALECECCNPGTEPPPPLPSPK